MSLVVATLLAILSVALVRWAGPDDDSAYIPPETLLTPEVRMLRAYLRINTSNPPGNETDGAKFLVAQLKEAGIEAEIIESSPGRGNVYARIRGSRDGEGLLLLHHIDVVPADPKLWSVPPFGGDVAMDRLYGRGALDMKGIGISHLIAFIEVAKSGRTPVRDIVFLATADEERGGREGIGWLVTHRPDIFRGISGAISEGGITEMNADKVRYFGVEVGSKQFIRTKLVSAARDELHRVRIALEPRFHPHDADRLVPGIREYFQRIAPHRITNGEIFRDPETAIARGSFWRLHRNYRTLAQNNLWAGGVWQSPDGSFSMDVVLQQLPDEDPKSAIERFRLSVAPVRVEVIDQTGVALLSSTGTELYRRIVKAVQGSYGRVDVGPYIFPYGTTDSRHLRQLGISAYGFFPFPVDFFQTESIHKQDEFIRLDRFRRGVRLLAGLVRDYAFQE